MFMGDRIVWVMVIRVVAIRNVAAVIVSDAIAVPVKGMDTVDGRLKENGAGPRFNLNDYLPRARALRMR